MLCALLGFAMLGCLVWFQGDAGPQLAVGKAANMVADLPAAAPAAFFPMQPAAAPYPPHYVDQAGVHYVAVPVDLAQQVQQAAYQAYMAGQPAQSAYGPPAQQYYGGAQWEAPAQQYSWSEQQAQQAQQTQAQFGGGSQGYQQPGAQADAAVLAQKLSPESAAYGVATSDNSSAYPASSSSYSYAPQQAAAATPGGFAQPATPAQAPAPYRPLSRPTASRPHLGPPVAGTGSSSAGVGSSQQPGGGPNLSVLLPGSR